MIQMMKTTIKISGTLNGHPIVGYGKSEIDLSTGQSKISISFTEIGPDVDPTRYGKSWHTKHHPRIALEASGAKNLMVLSPEGYTFVTTMKFDSGESVVSKGQVRRTGTNDSIYELNLHGSIPKMTKNKDDRVGRILPATAVIQARPTSVVHMQDTELLVLSDHNTITIKEEGEFILFSEKAPQPSDQNLLVTTEKIVYHLDTKTLELETTAKISVK